MIKASNSISNLVCQGDRNVYEVDRGPAKAFLTAKFTYSASELMCLRIVIYQHQQIPSEMTIPDDRGLGHSPTGQKTAEVFYHYTKHPFIPHFGKHFPVILFATGHSNI